MNMNRMVAPITGAWIETGRNGYLHILADHEHPFWRIMNTYSGSS